MKLRSDLLRTLGTALSAAALAVSAAGAWAAEAGTSEASQGHDAQVEPLSSSVTAEDVRPARSSRLRFRGDGPTCMCADGLSEREIRISQSRNKKTPTQSTPP